MQSFLDGGPPNFASLVTAFAAEYPGDYDYIFLLTEAFSSNSAFGRFEPIRSPNLPSIGLPAMNADPAYSGLPRLRGVVALQLGPTQTNGPTLHESLHAFGNFLDPSLGFGKDAKNNFGAHWGPTGVHGQLGGFDPATLKCLAPSAQATTTCTKAQVGEFDATANGGDSVPYAPLELYLMGLMSASEITAPIPIFVDATFEGAAPGSTDLLFTLGGGIRQLTMAQIVQTMGGERPPAAAADRSLRAAFVVVTDGATKSPTALMRASKWARVLGGVDAGGGLLSYCKATGGRATMRTDLPPH